MVSLHLLGALGREARESPLLRQLERAAVEQRGLRFAGAGVLPFHDEDLPVLVVMLQTILD